MLGAVAVLSSVGICYPIKMLPVMFFKLVWKTIWLVAFGLPLWRSECLDADTGETMSNRIFGVAVVLIAIQWCYVHR